MSEAIKFPRGIVLEVLIELLHCFDPAPAWHRPNALVEIACAVGGYRRGKRAMKDLEILYVPRVSEVVDPSDMFGATTETNLAEVMLEDLRLSGVLAKRLKSDGSVSSWGPCNKHALHVPSGLPVDLFAATADNYHNRMVVTTGPLESNIRIAEATRKMGWEWEVNSPGFVPLGGTWESCPRERRTMRCEREVFEFVGLPFLRPEERR